MSVVSAQGDTSQSLNAIYNIPSPPYKDELVLGLEEIPNEYKEHIGKNISVPDEEDGNNLIGQILGIKKLYLHKLGEYDFYEVLFQADEKHSKAVVKIICTLKYGIKVLGLETEADMMERIKQAQAATLANQDSVQMRILERLAEERGKPKRQSGKKKESESLAINFLDRELGESYGESMLQQGIASIPDELEFARPSTVSRSSSPKSEKVSPGTLTRTKSFEKNKERRRIIGGKKTKKAKKTKKVKKMQKRKKTKRR